MKVTVVIDNYVPISASRPFLGEHGFSLLLETSGHKILMDTGQSGAVIHNLSLLGVHPDQLDAIVLSHGHYDHAGGLEYILEHRSKPIPVYAHPNIFKERFSVAGGHKHEIGISCIKEKLTTWGAEWHFSDKPLEICEQLVFGGQIPRKTSYEVGDTKLITTIDKCMDCQDELEDDSSLYYITASGLVVISGCAHSGMINIIEYGLAITQMTHLRGWIGGMHLGPVAAEQRNKSLEAIKNFAPDFVAASHCTGFAMMAELQHTFGKQFIHCCVSQVIHID